ncbi:TPA: DUF551 domain-containing protein [Yersinia enterocolitica]
MKELDGFTVEQLNDFIKSDHAQCGDVAALARIALAAKRAEPVAWLLSGGGAKNIVTFDSGNAYVDPLREVTPLYTTPQLNSPQGWIKCGDRMPDSETPVLILLNGIINIGEIRWDTPTYEETYTAFKYWDSPFIDGQPWEVHDVTHWMPLPAALEKP